MKTLLWIILAGAAFGFFLALHIELQKHSVYGRIRKRYRDGRRRRSREENAFVKRFGQIENKSLFYRIDRQILMSGLKNRFPHLNGETYLVFLLISAICGATLGTNLTKNFLAGLFLAALVLTAEILVVIILSGLSYNRIEDDTALFVSVLSNNAKSSSDIVTIMERTLPSMEGPIHGLIRKFLINCEKTGDVDAAFDYMKESVENRTFRTIVVNLKNCSRFMANYEEVLQQMIGQISDAAAAREERKNILFSMKITLVGISVMSVVIVLLIGKGLGIDVPAILTGNTMGQFILFLTGILYLFVFTKLFGVDK